MASAQEQHHMPQLYTFYCGSGCADIYDALQDLVQGTAKVWCHNQTQVVWLQNNNH